MKTNISIVSQSSISALGHKSDLIWQNYLDNKTYISKNKIGNKEVWASKLTAEIILEIEKLQNSDSKYKNLDKSVLYAIFVAREAVNKAKWNKADVFGINIGSSRGATELFENYHKEFLETNTVATLSSPTTTLGNISSWVANDLQASGPERPIYQCGL